MENILNLQEIGEDAARQYIDAKTCFVELRRAQAEAADVRGGMFWKQQGGHEYLIRTNLHNGQKSLGPRSPETEQMFSKFTQRKAALEARVATLTETMQRHSRVNRALYVGRAPRLLVDILNLLEDSGLAAHFRVVGTHALYAYEAAAGVRVEAGALATQDIDLLWHADKRIRFFTQLKRLDSSMLGLLRKVDPSFRLSDEDRYTAINDKGFQVDILRREPIEGDPHPLKLSEDTEEEDFFAVPALNAKQLDSGKPYTAVIAATNGEMATMHTIHPALFARFKRWLAERPNREAFKRERDLAQAQVAEKILREYLPHEA